MFSTPAYYLFVGNPGTGKSTIINGVVGSPVFRARPSFDGSGVTWRLDEQYIEGKGTFMDTPGLADDDAKEQAAAAITEALKKDGDYRIFFVMTEESGRIRPADKATMKLVLDAAPDITDYSIIVNKVDENWRNQLIDEASEKNWIAKLMSGLPKVTSSIFFNIYDRALASKSDVQYNAPEGLKHFILSAPHMRVHSRKVSDVQTSEFAQIIRQHEETQQKLEKDQAVLRSLVESQAQELANAKQRAEDARTEYENKLKEVRAEERQKSEEQQREQFEMQRREQEAEFRRQIMDQRNEMADATKRAEDAMKRAEDAQKELEERLKQEKDELEERLKQEKDEMEHRERQRCEEREQEMRNHMMMMHWMVMQQQQPRSSYLPVRVLMYRQ